MKAGLVKRGLGKTITVYNDAIGALRAGSPDGTGVVIACGTGAAMGARNHRGEFWHTSYWQDSLGGREIGYSAIRAVRHADIGIEPPTTLTASILAFFGKESVAEVLRLFTLRPQHPPSDIQVSKLAPFVLTEAENGDPVAHHLIEDHGVRLAEYALAAARKVDIEQTSFPLILNGGIFRHPGTLLTDTILKRMRATSPNVTVYRSTFEPVVGAVMLGYEAIGMPITTALADSMRASMPPREFFHT
ncbi:MAG: BadF/BadG/BcrA/BcrD ATPase family protein [Anaerolineae bacterium]